MPYSRDKLKSKSDFLLDRAVQKGTDVNIHDVLGQINQSGAQPPPPTPPPGMIDDRVQQQPTTAQQGQVGYPSGVARSLSLAEIMNNLESLHTPRSPEVDYFQQEGFPQGQDEYWRGEPGSRRWRDTEHLFPDVSDLYDINDPNVLLQDALEEASWVGEYKLPPIEVTATEADQMGFDPNRLIHAGEDVYYITFQNMPDYEKFAKLRHEKLGWVHHQDLAVDSEYNPHNVLASERDLDWHQQLTDPGRYDQMMADRDASTQERRDPQDKVVELGDPHPELGGPHPIENPELGDPHPELGGPHPIERPGGAMEWGMPDRPDREWEMPGYSAPDYGALPGIEAPDRPDYASPDYGALPGIEARPLPQPDPRVDMPEMPEFTPVAPPAGSGGAGHTAMPAVGTTSAPQAEGYERAAMPEFAPDRFEGEMPDPELMSLEEMKEYVEKRSSLRYDPQIESLKRELEVAEMEGERTRGEIEAAYKGAIREIDKTTYREQQRGASTMAARNVYDSGMAADLATRISHRAQALGMQVEQEQARQLADLGEYLNLQKRHTREEIHQIMGEKATFAETALHEMKMDQQDRTDRLRQEEFQNWLAEEAHNTERERMMQDQYWRETTFGADEAHRAWDRGMRGAEFEYRQQHDAWMRAMEERGFTAAEAQRAWERNFAGAEFQARQQQEAWQRAFQDRAFTADMDQRYWERDMQTWQMDYNMQQDAWMRAFQDRGWTADEAHREWDRAMRGAEFDYGMQQDEWMRAFQDRGFTADEAHREWDRAMREAEFGADMDYRHWDMDMREAQFGADMDYRHWDMDMRERMFGSDMDYRQWDMMMREHQQEHGMQMDREQLSLQREQIQAQLQQAEQNMRMAQEELQHRIQHDANMTEIQRQQLEHQVINAEREYEMRQWQMEQNERAMEMDEYWRGQEFDLGLYDRDREDWRWGEEFDFRQDQDAWDRIETMNRWEAEYELEMLRMENLISQQEFQNILALDDFELKQALYRAQYPGF